MVKKIQHLVERQVTCETLIVKGLTKATSERYRQVEESLTVVHWRIINMEK